MFCLHQRYHKIIFMTLIIRLTSGFSNFAKHTSKVETSFGIHSLLSSNRYSRRNLSTTTTTTTFNMKSMTAMDEMNKGEFRRTASTFRNFIKADGSTEYPVESGRYHLIISYACPWACRWYVHTYMFQSFCKNSNLYYTESPHSQHIALSLSLS